MSLLAAGRVYTVDAGASREATASAAAAHMQTGSARSAARRVWHSPTDAAGCPRVQPAASFHVNGWALPGTSFCTYSSAAILAGRTGRAPHHHRHRRGCCRGGDCGSSDVNLCLLRRPRVGEGWGRGGGRDAGTPRPRPLDPTRRPSALLRSLFISSPPCFLSRAQEDHPWRNGGARRRHLHPPAALAAASRPRPQRIGQPSHRRPRGTDSRRPRRKLPVGG